MKRFSCLLLALVFVLSLSACSTGTSDVEAVPQALEIAAQTNKIAWQNVVFALAVKLIVMILGLFGHASMWLAVFADSGVAMLCVLNSIRLLYKKQ